jgi:DHA1 family bicyclomycin/chloramphenicol resistance-like MFS transporter
MMLWHGALSDALGRRAVVLGGLAVYAVATLGCAIAGNIESLWLFRALQGLSAGTGLVVGRAIIRDAFHGPEAQRLMSQTTLVFGIAPALGPILGGALLNLLGWRSIFWALLALVLGVLAWAALRLPETLPPAARQPLHPRALWHNYRAVSMRLDFLLLVFIPALSFSGFFLYIASAPAFLIGLLGVTTWGFAWLFVPMIAGIMLGATLSGRLAGRLSPQRTIRLGYAIMFAGIGSMVVCWHVPGRSWSAPMMIAPAAASSCLRSPCSCSTCWRARNNSSLRAVLHALRRKRGRHQRRCSCIHARAGARDGGFTCDFALWLVYQRRAGPREQAP